MCANIDAFNNNGNHYNGNEYEDNGNEYNDDAEYDDDSDTDDDIIYDPDEASQTRYNIVLCELHNPKIHGIDPA